MGRFFPGRKWTAPDAGSFKPLKIVLCKPGRFGVPSGRMKIRQALYLLWLALASVAVAQEPAVITVKKTAGQIDLHLIPLTGPEGAAATKTVADDLNMAGSINLSAAATGYIARGSAGGGALQGTLTDRGGVVRLNQAYPGNARSAAHQFANDIVLELTKTPGIAGSKVAFIGTRTGHKEVYTCDLDGSNLKQLTNDANISVRPTLSPDGRRLAYTGYKSGYADVYVIDLASGARERVVKFPGTNSGAAFSPDGARLALSCSRDGNPELYVTSATGANARRLTRTPGVESSPTWSPDGTEIIYVSDAGGAPQLYRISAAGGSGRRLGAGFGYCTEPNWSPDGQKVAFNVRGGGGFEIAVLDLAAGGARTVVSASAEDPVWAADSRHVIYSDGTSLHLVDVPTGKDTRVVGGVGKISEPSITRQPPSSL